MKKYNLTVLQRLQLIPLWILWFFYAGDRSERKSWHLVKKGLEKHVCRFVNPVVHYGFTFYQCDHEGCDTVDDEPSKP